MRVCSRCEKPKEDATGYVFKSDGDKHHTYWSFDLCFECRDIILTIMGQDIHKEEVSP